MSRRVSVTEAPGTQPRTQPRARRTSLLRELASLGPVAVIGAAFLVTAIRGDVFPGEVALALGAIALFHLLPGALLWRVVRPRDGWLVEDLAIGLALGVALAVPTQIVAAATGLGMIAWLVPLGLTAGLLGLPGPRSRIASRRYVALPWWWGASLVVPVGASLVDYLKGLRYPVRWPGFAERYIDRAFHEGLVEELLHRWPLRYPWVSSEEVAYHWFSHAWNANVATLSGTGVDVILWRVSPALIDVAAPLVLAVVAVRLTGRAWAGPLAAAVAYVANTLQPWRVAMSSSPLALESPSQEFASLIFPALLALVALRWSGSLGRGSTPLLLLMLLVCSGSKGTTLAVLIPGLLLATVAAALFARPYLRRVLTDTAMTVGMFLLAGALIFGGETKNLEIKPLEWMATSMGLRLATEADPWTLTGLGLVVIGLLTMLLVATAVLGALGTRSGRADPVLWLLLGGACTGIGALLFFVQVAQSHVYFYKISLIPFGLAVAYATSHLVGDRPARPILLTGLVTGAVGGGVVALVVGDASDPSPLVAWLTIASVVLLVAAGSYVLRRGRGAAEVALAASVGLVVAAMVAPVVTIVTYDRPERAVHDERIKPWLIHASEVRALRWLRDHSHPDDLVAANRHCRGRTRPDCDRRRFDVASYSERRVLVEGWAYTPKGDAQYDPDNRSRWTAFWDPEVIEANDAFFRSPDAASREKLLQLGVRWLVVDKLAPHAKTLEPWATLRHRTRFMQVYELVPARE